jgi:ribosomal protein S18 acetylase RimI-like enzyme
MASMIDPPEITISATQPSDADLLLELVRASHVEDGHILTPASEAAVRHIAEDEPFARAWIVRLGGRAVGYLVITLGYSIEYEGRDEFIDELHLAPEARGRGFGKQLINFALVQAVQLGIGTLHLEVECDNKIAHHLYRAAGFKETGRQFMSRRLQLD